METLYILLGLAMMYSWIHFMFISWTKTYKKRTQYEKFVTWFAIVGFVLYIIGSTS